MSKRPMGKCRSGCPATPSTICLSATVPIPDSLRGHQTARRGAGPPEPSRRLGPTGHKAQIVAVTAFELPGTTPTRPAGRDASVPWGSPAITSRRDHGLSLATPPGRSPNSRASQVGALASQFCPRIPSRHQGADQACQGEVGRTSTVMEKLTGIRPCVVGPDLYSCPTCIITLRRAPSTPVARLSCPPVLFPCGFGPVHRRYNPHESLDSTGTLRPRTRSVEQVIRSFT